MFTSTNLYYFPGILLSCRNIVSYFHQSSKATLKLNQLCCGQTKSRLVQEISTRWNSTFLMIQSLVELRGPLTDSLKAMDRQDLLLDDEEWEILSGAIKILEPFHRVTADLSSQFYPSLSKVIPSIRILHLNLSQIGDSEFHQTLKDLLRGLRTNMKDRFDLLLSTSTAHLVSTFLDPR